MRPVPRRLATATLRTLARAPLGLQAIGLGWVAAIAKPGMGYAELGLALIVAGVGTSMCLPTGPDAAISAVPPQEAGVASGTYNVFQQLGGVLGILTGLGVVHAMQQMMKNNKSDFPPPHISSSAILIGFAFSVLVLVLMFRPTGLLGESLGRARAGIPLTDALQQVADRTSLDALAGRAS